MKVEKLFNNMEKKELRELIIRNERDRVQKEKCKVCIERRKRL